MKNFGGVMKQQMFKKGIKQEVLAHQLNIARTTVTAYCNNKRQPDLETLANICNLLEINIGWLLGLPDFDNSDMYLHDDYEVKVNQACRRVAKHKRQKFLEGVSYLADILAIDDQEEILEPKESDKILEKV